MDVNEDRITILIFQEAWGHGGIETFVMNAIRVLGTERYSFEIWSAYDWYDGFDDELASLGVPRTAAFPGEMPSLVRRFRVGTKMWRERLSRGDVDIVHVNAMNGSTLAYVDIARQCGVPVRVAHSHNSDFTGVARALKSVLHRIGQRLWERAATVRLACSEEAGAYLFAGSPFQFLPNGIDTSRFAFDVEARGSVRKNLGVGEKTLVVGSLGRISEQKNPLFSVRVLAELIASGVDARLLLIGDGSLEGETLLLAERLGVADLYTHIPSVENPEDYYCALDAFLMPSFFEGLPYSLIEAQCSGLPCVVSEAIQDEACVTPLVRMVPLSEGSAAWAVAVSDEAVRHSERRAYSDDVAAAGFSVGASVAYLEEVYRHA
ncbi:glycosyltransferase [Parafannyhessea umbonata]|uniref:glycosyltransferase n=1 Tax=Parafannyhessea umbonata TaxID=604330 RepID=UPI000B80757D|nr:glycosyltransferase [Parafannyhessea umbonata]